mmetsp:Transcript_32951/g.87072  ORF Transcript_32951/g.87072 Transcript_32951/m.87072 type:complete len:564 (+) Transcript_32951:12-1703(+)
MQDADASAVGSRPEGRARLRGEVEDRLSGPGLAQMHARELGLQDLQPLRLLLRLPLRILRRALLGLPLPVLDHSGVPVEALGHQLGVVPQGRLRGGEGDAVVLEVICCFLLPLEELLRRQPLPRSPRVLPPLGLLGRQSAEAAVERPVVKELLGFIQRHEIHLQKAPLLQLQVALQVLQTLVGARLQLLQRQLPDVHGGLLPGREGVLSVGGAPRRARVRGRRGAGAHLLLALQRRGQAPVVRRQVRGRVGEDVSPRDSQLPHGACTVSTLAHGRNGAHGHVYEVARGQARGVAIKGSVHGGVHQGALHGVHGVRVREGCGGRRADGGTEAGLTEAIRGGHTHERSLRDLPHVCNPLRPGSPIDQDGLVPVAVLIVALLGSRPHGVSLREQLPRKVRRLHVQVLNLLHRRHLRHGCEALAHAPRLLPCRLASRLLLTGRVLRHEASTRLPPAGGQGGVHELELQRQGLADLDGELHHPRRPRGRAFYHLGEVLRRTRHVPRVPRLLRLDGRARHGLPDLVELALGPARLGKGLGVPPVGGERAAEVQAHQPLRHPPRRPGDVA